jgi:integrase/recombinase XerC
LNLKWDKTGHFPAVSKGRKVNLKQLTNAKTSGLSFTDALNAFMLHQRTSRHTEQTVRYYNYTLNKFGAWLESAGVQDLEQVSPTLLRQFMLDLEETLRPNSVHAVMRGVRALFSFLLNEEMLDSDPMRKVKMPKGDKTLLEPFTPEEIKTLFKATEGKDPISIRNRAIIVVLLDSGIRLSECASLKVGDIDPITGTFKVLGKGRKERLTKIGNHSLKSFIKYSRLLVQKNGDPLWIGKYGAMTPAGIAEVLEKLGKSVGVHVHPHKFRRTCALMMLRNGADVFSVQNLLGHADLGVLRRYVSQNDRDIAQAHSEFSVVDRL